MSKTRIIGNEFEIGQTVYLKTDEDQRKHLVTRIILEASNIVYEISCNGYRNEVYDFEISGEVDKNIKMGIEQ